MERYFQTISAIGELFIEKILFEFDKEPIVIVYTRIGYGGFDNGT